METRLMSQTVTTAVYENIGDHDVRREIINHPAFMAAGTFVPSRSEERLVLELHDGFTAIMSEGTAWITYRGHKGRTIECCHTRRLEDTAKFVAWAVECGEGLKALLEE
jgi:hypothetical protein